MEASCATSKTASRACDEAQLGDRLSSNLEALVRSPELGQTGSPEAEPGTRNRTASQQHKVWKIDSHKQIMGSRLRSVLSEPQQRAGKVAPWVKETAMSD